MIITASFFYIFVKNSNSSTCWTGKINDNNYIFFSTFSLKIQKAPRVELARWMIIYAFLHFSSSIEEPRLPLDRENQLRISEVSWVDFWSESRPPHSFWIAIWSAVHRESNRDTPSDKAEKDSAERVALEGPSVEGFIAASLRKTLTKGKKNKTIGFFSFFFFSEKMARIRDICRVGRSACKKKTPRTPRSRRSYPWKAKK